MVERWPKQVHRRVKLEAVRRYSYQVGRVAGDINALLGGPEKIVKRLVNKWIGRNIVRRLWLR